MLIPGVGEAEIAANAAKEASAASRALGAAGEVKAFTSATQEAGAAADGVAAAQAATGVTKGSALARTFRALNPYEYVGKAGEAVGGAVSSVLGGGRVAKVVSPLARFATEGAIIGAANTVDEHELGDTDLTGESILAGAESGALWGTGLGVVGTGVGKMVTAGGRMAVKLAEAQLGGSPGELRQAISRFGRGGLANRMLEEPGYSPFMDADKQYELAQNMKEKDGANLARVVKDADSAYAGVSAKEVRREVLASMEKAADQYAIAGGNPELIKRTIMREVDAGLGWHAPPEMPPFIPPHTADDIYEHWWKQAGLNDPSELKRPRAPTQKAITELAQSYAAKEIQPITQEALRAEILDAAKNRRVTADYNPMKVLEAKQAEQRVALLEQAKSELMAKYSDQYDKYTAENARHAELRVAAADNIQQEARAHATKYQRLVAAADASNKNLRATFDQARTIRQKLDGVIPWNKVHSASGLDNAAVEVKIAARQALEGKIEESLDNAASKVNDPTTYANYLHAKQRYAESSLLANMAQRGQARSAGMFGRASRVGGVGMVVAGELAGVALGHPVLGAMAGVAGAIGRHYGPKVAASVLHKAARIAEIKALREEVLIATRRGVRSGLGQSAAKPYAKVALQSMAPHELRMNAAQAMAKVMSLGKEGAGLRSRLAALNPAFPVVAPESFGKAEGAYRRQVNWLIQQIPAHIMAQYQNEGRVNPRELSDSASREFMQHYAVVQDPRTATDALANGNLSASAAKAYAGAWPALNKEAVLTYKAMKQRNLETYDFLPNRRKDNVSMLLQDDLGASTLKLQANAVSFMGQPPAPPSGRSRKGSQTGLQHSRDTSKGMAISMAANATASQMAESGPPGRRQGARGSAGLGF